LLQPSNQAILVMFPLPGTLAIATGAKHLNLKSLGLNLADKGFAAFGKVVFGIEFVDAKVAKSQAEKMISHQPADSLIVDPHEGKPIVIA
jgi:hypothetical protein